ncbi:MAG: LytR C-terminal domain-containing protein [Acidimicrobiales bacterium]
MTAGAHDAGGGFSRSAGTNAARGVLVIIAAVAVGLLLMFRGIGDSSNDTAADATPAADGGGDTSDAAAAGDTSTTVPTGDTVVESTTTTVSAPPRDPSEVKVLVLNGTDATSRVAGVAGAGTDLLKPSNYITLEPKDADINGPSAVFYTEGYLAEANAVAAVYGVDPATVVQPLDPTASPIADTQGANIVVRIGSDGVIKV